MTYAVNIAQGGSSNTTFRNRIINGSMTIDQRNAGASVTPTDGQYTLDRWRCFVSQTSKLTCQQNAGSVTPPAGFINYAGITSSSAYSVGAADYFAFSQFVEGLNAADLGWGTANAATVTVSFWVRSSLTGTFGGAIKNSTGNRSYPFTYTISAANTWEQKSVTIAGDTSGTWLTTNSTCLQLHFGLGVGSNQSGTAGSWSGGNYFTATGSTSVVGTSGATWYITGVQLEAGTTATPFEVRPYGTELALCQRYYERVYINGSMPIAITHCFTTGASYGVYPFKVEKRAAPVGVSSGTFIALTAAGSNGGGSLTFDALTTSAARIGITGASGLVAGYASSVWGDYSPMMAFNAEL